MVQHLHYTELLLYICAPTFLFLGHCTYKSSHGKALIWSGKVMEIDFSKVVETMGGGNVAKIY